MKARLTNTPAPVKKTKNQETMELLCAIKELFPDTQIRTYSKDMKNVINHETNEDELSNE